MEQWRVVLENLLDNQPSYANSHILLVELKQEKDNKAFLKIWNDGPPIEQEIIETLFNKF